MRIIECPEYEFMNLLTYFRGRPSADFVQAQLEVIEDRVEASSTEEGTG